jgi:hypothetical protein
MTLQEAKSIARHLGPTLRKVRSGDDYRVNFRDGNETGRDGKDGATGPRGERGERGSIGPRGEPAPAISGWRVDCAAHAAVPLLSDGSEGAPLELRGLFKQFLDEVAPRA